MLRRILALLVASFVLAACGGKAGEDTTNPIESITKDPLTSEEIKKVLLTLEDLPSGYSEDPELTSEDEEDSDEVTSGSQPCKDLMAALDAEEEEKPHGEGEIGFKESDFGPFVMEAVASFEGDKLKKTMQTFQDAFTECRKFTTTDSEGVDTNFTAAPMSFPKLGDESVAVRLTAKEDSDFDFEIDFDLVAVRTDQNVVLMASLGFGKSMSGEDFEKLVRTAVQRVSDAA